MKLYVAIPTHGSWEPAFGHSLALLFADLARDPHPKARAFRLTRCESSKLPQARTDLVRDALKNGADHILWLDSDMQFNPGNVRALLSDDGDIVACNYVKKMPEQPSVCVALDGTVLKPGAGVEEVAHAGMGIMLTRAEMFRKLPEPWFQFRYDRKTGDDIGEDVWFCRRARKHGYRVLIDHDASVGVRHIGKFAYGVA